jgi:type VI secretion system protein ImpB
MEALGPRVKARVKNTLPQAEGQERDEELALDLTFTKMGDFAPDKIAAQVPQLAEILKMRRQLEELLGFMDGRVDAEKRIAQLLNNEPLLGKIASQALTDDDKAGE